LDGPTTTLPGSAAIPGRKEPIRPVVVVKRRPELRAMYPHRSRLSFAAHKGIDQFGNFCSEAFIAAPRGRVRRCLDNNQSPVVVMMTTTTTKAPQSAIMIVQRLPGWWLVRQVSHIVFRYHVRIIHQSRRSKQQIDVR
jgi:hypothetical protein